MGQEEKSGGNRIGGREKGKQGERKERQWVQGNLRFASSKEDILLSSSQKLQMRKGRDFIHRKTKLKNSLTPGTIVILLAGSFKGKRCVFLKQLESGLLLVAGPKAVNGVPLRRVNQAYVIGTSTKITFSGLDLSKFTDEYFKRPVSARGSSGEEEFFDEKPKKFTSEATPEYLEDNKTVDAILSKAIDAVPQLKGYLQTRFTLSKGDRPHLMKF